jgi:hypothetical protein
MKAYGGVDVDSYFLDLGTSWRWVDSINPWPLYPSVHSGQEVGWTPEPVWTTRRENSWPYRDSKSVASRYTDYATRFLRAWCMKAYIWHGGKIKMLYNEALAPRIAMENTWVNSVLWNRPQAGLSSNWGSILGMNSDFYIFFTTIRPILWSTQPPIQWEPKAPSLELKLITYLHQLPLWIRGATLLLHQTSWRGAYLSTGTALLYNTNWKFGGSHKRTGNGA